MDDDLNFVVSSIAADDAEVWEKGACRLIKLGKYVKK